MWPYPATWSFNTLIIGVTSPWFSSICLTLNSLTISRPHLTCRSSLSIWLSYLITPPWLSVVNIFFCWVVPLLTSYAVSHFSSSFQLFLLLFKHKLKKQTANWTFEILYIDLVSIVDTPLFIFNSIFLFNLTVIKFVQVQHLWNMIYCNSIAPILGQCCKYIWPYVVLDYKSGSSRLSIASVLQIWCWMKTCII